jgi:hypothetical protein
MKSINQYQRNCIQNVRECLVLKNINKFWMLAPLPECLSNEKCIHKLELFGKNKIVACSASISIKQDGLQNEV